MITFFKKRVGPALAGTALSFLLFSCATVPQTSQTEMVEERITGERIQKSFEEDKNLLPENQRHLYEQGSRLLGDSGAGSLEQAAEIFRIIIKKSPSFWQARYKLALCAYLQGNYDEAEKQIGRVLKEARDRQEAITLQADVYLKQGKSKKAFLLYRQLSLRYPDPQYAYFQMGNIKMAEKKYWEALNFYSEGGELNRELYQLYVNKGSCYMKLDLYDEALATFKAVYDLKIKEKELIKQYALGLRKRGKLHKAITMYKELAAHYPREKSAYKNLGIIYELYLNDPQSAVTYYKKYLNAGGKDKRIENWIDVAGNKLGSRLNERPLEGKKLSLAP